jgi:hypothetical protein
LSRSCLINVNNLKVTYNHVSTISEMIFQGLQLQ